MYGERRPEFDPNQLLQSLSEAWKRFTSKLPGGGGTSIGVILIAVVAIGLWLASGIYQVAPNEQAATQLFGKFQSVQDPGLLTYTMAPQDAVANFWRSMLRQDVRGPPREVQEGCL